MLSYVSAYVGTVFAAIDSSVSAAIISAFMGSIDTTVVSSVSAAIVSAFMGAVVAADGDTYIIS